MPDTTMTADAPMATTDPFRTVADAMAMAAHAARDGAADAKAHVSEMMPAVGGLFSRLTYTTCYAVSYGVVFPTLLMARAVPKENALVYGLVDGARAAREAVTVQDRSSRGADGPAEGERREPAEPGELVPA